MSFIGYITCYGYEIVMTGDVKLQSFLFTDEDSSALWRAL